MRRMIITLLSVAVLFSGCASKSMVTSDGKKYTKGSFDSEWKLEESVDESASKPEESVGYAAGQAVGAAAVAGAFILTLPIRIVETAAKSSGADTNSSNATSLPKE